MHTTNLDPTQKSHFLAYKPPGWFNTAIFLKSRIFRIILVEQIYMVTLKVPRKWPLKLDKTVIPIQETWHSKMLPEDVLSKYYSRTTHYWLSTKHRCFWKIAYNLMVVWYQNVRFLAPSNWTPSEYNLRRKLRLSSCFRM